jgi:hypothetical protein
MGNLTGCSESQSFDSLTNQSTLLVGRADVWWYIEDLYLILSQVTGQAPGLWSS